MVYHLFIIVCIYSISRFVECLGKETGSTAKYIGQHLPEEALRYKESKDSNLEDHDYLSY